MDPTRQKLVPKGTPGEDLLVPIFEGGRRVYDPPALSDARARTIAQLAGFNAGVKRLANPHQYPVGLERKLHDLKTALVLQARQIEPVGVAV
jgi:nicotinate phosphoribosyltransferase